MKKANIYIFFSLMFILGSICACRKDKPPIPPEPKTIEDHIRQMLGTHKMIGQYEYLAPPPINDTLVKEDENWVIDLHTSTSIIVNEPVTNKTTFTYAYHDEVNKRLKFVRDSVVFKDGDNIYYYYLADSITYFGYEKTSMTSYVRNLHSVK